MPKIISLALGTLYRWTRSKNKNNLIKYVKSLGINGIEVTFSSKEDLYAFKLSGSNEDWLKSLNYVTIHAPFRLVQKADNEAEVIKQLNVIAKIYKKINAKNVIIHPQNLPRPEILKRFKFKVSTENLPRKQYVKISNLKKILKKYPQIGFCLDISHAYSCSKYETRKLIKAFNNKITQIHFSGTYRRKDHQSLRKVSKNFIFSIKPVFKLDIPIVIEEEIKNEDEQFLKEEVDYIKNIFKIDYGYYEKSKKRSH